MFKILDACNILGFDTETGIRYTASDTELIEISHTMNRKYHITDYADPLDCVEAVLKTYKALEADAEKMYEYKQKGSLSILNSYIMQYALNFMFSADKLNNYDLVSKITYPRFCCIVGTDFKNIIDFTKAEGIFNTDQKTDFILKDHAEDFIRYICSRICKDENIAIVSFNLEYDFNTLMCNVEPTLLYDLGIIDERLPTKIHADKTITWKSKDKKCKGCCKWIDAMLLSEKGMSIKKYGQLASSIYGKDYNKYDDYEYDNVIYSAADLKPDKKELRYCYRDTQLALWGLSYLLKNHVSTLNKCDLLKKPSDLPITCSHLYDMVNVINTLNIDMSYSKSKRRKYFSSYKKKTAKNNEQHYNPADLNLYQYFKAGFGGGKIAFNPLYLEKKLSGGNGYSLDLCSAYPYQMVNVYPDLQKVYILDQDYFHEDLQQILRLSEEMYKGNFINIIPAFKYGWTARIKIEKIRLKKDMQLPILGEHDGNIKMVNPVIIRNRVMAADEIIISVTIPDLITLLAAYEYKEITLIDGFVYALKPMNTNIRRKFTEAAAYKSGIKKFMKLSFDKFPVEDFNSFVGQQILSAKDTEAEHITKLKDCYQNSKVLFNGIYGKACQSLIHSKKYIDEEGNISITQDTYKPRQGTCYTTGRYIATYTRLHLVNLYFIALRIIDKNDLILYAHTDSLKLYLFSNDHDRKIKQIIQKYNEGINEECDTFLSNGMKINNPVTHEEYKRSYDILKANGIGLVENETENQFDKVIVCGNMRILTQKGDKCHITFSGVNIPYVLSGGKQNYTPDRLEKMLSEKGIFQLYDEYFCSGKKYTMYESCKTVLDYKHYNFLLNDKLGRICQTIKEMPIEINGDPDRNKRDLYNIDFWKGYIRNA